MSNPYVEPYQTPQPSGQPSPWATGSGFGTPPAPADDLDLLAGSSYQNYSQPAPDPEPQGLAVPQFPGATQYVPSGMQAGVVSPYYGLTQAPEHPNAGTVLGLGIASLAMLFFGFPITGPFAWYLGSKARREMRQNPGRYRESTNLTAGWVMGIVTSILMLLGLLLIVFVLMGVALFAVAG